MATIDIFTYNGEEDILEMRLNILDDFVDQFVIVEAPTTFSGEKKPLYFEKSGKRFDKWKDKIKYYVVEPDYPGDESILALADSSPNVPVGGPEHWRREFYQKESIKKALTHLNSDDMCFVGDVDEIWAPGIYTVPRGAVFKLRQKVYVYTLTNRSEEEWAGTLLTDYETISNTCLNHLRTNGKWSYLNNAGWHFTSMGGYEEVKRKLANSYTEQSYNSKEVQAALRGRIESKQDFLGRGFRYWHDETDWPQYLKDNRDKFSHLC